MPSSQRTTGATAQGHAAGCPDREAGVSVDPGGRGQWPEMLLAERRSWLPVLPRYSVELRCPVG